MVQNNFNHRRDSNTSSLSSFYSSMKSDIGSNPLSSQSSRVGSDRSRSFAGNHSAYDPISSDISNASSYSPTVAAQLQRLHTRASASHLTQTSNLVVQHQHPIPSDDSSGIASGRFSSVSSQNTNPMYGVDRSQMMIRNTTTQVTRPMTAISRQGQHSQINGIGRPPHVPKQPQQQQQSAIYHPNNNIVLEELEEDKFIEENKNLVLPDEMVQYLNQVTEIVPQEVEIIEQAPSTFGCAASSVSYYDQPHSNEDGRSHYSNNRSHTPYSVTDANSQHMMSPAAQPMSPSTVQIMSPGHPPPSYSNPPCTNTVPPQQACVNNAPPQQNYCQHPPQYMHNKNLHHQPRTNNDQCYHPQHSQPLHCNQGFNHMSPQYQPPQQCHSPKTMCPQNQYYPQHQHAMPQQGCPDNNWCPGEPQQNLRPPMHTCNHHWPPPNNSYMPQQSAPPYPQNQAMNPPCTQNHTNVPPLQNKPFVHQPAPQNMPQVYNAPNTNGMPNVNISQTPVPMETNQILSPPPSALVQNSHTCPHFNPPCTCSQNCRNCHAMAQEKHAHAVQCNAIQEKPHCHNCSGQQPEIQCQQISQSTKTMTKESYQRTLEYVQQCQQMMVAKQVSEPVPSENKETNQNQSVPIEPIIVTNCQPMEHSPGCNKVTSTTEPKDKKSNIPVATISANNQEMKSANPLPMQNFPPLSRAATRSSSRATSNQNSEKSGYSNSPLLSVSNMVIHDMNSTLTSLVQETKYLQMMH